MTERRVRAYVGLGANVGAPEATLAKAVMALAALPGVRLRGVSLLYATKPVGVTRQPEFRNAVAALDVPGGPDASTGALALLALLKDLERALGRRPRGRWGPRELDLDLLIFGRAQLAIERTPETRSIDVEIDPAKASKLLELPHPAAASRLFVLAPLADLASGLVPPGWGRSVETARRQQLRREGPAAVRPVASWDLGGAALAPDSAEVAGRELGLDRRAGRPADDPVPAGGRARGDHLGELGAPKDQGGAIVGREAVRQGSLPTSC